MPAQNIVNVNLYTTTDHKLPPLTIWAWLHRDAVQVNVYAANHAAAPLLNSKGRYTVPRWLKRTLTPTTANLVHRAALLTAKLAKTVPGTTNVSLFMDVCTGAKLRMPMTGELAATAQLVYGGAPWRAVTACMDHDKLQYVWAHANDELVDLTRIDGDATVPEEVRLAKLTANAATAAVNKLIDTANEAMKGGCKS